MLLKLVRKIRNLRRERKIEKLLDAAEARGKERAKETFKKEVT